MSPREHAEQIDAAFRQLHTAVKAAHADLPVGQARVAVANMLDLAQDFNEALDELNEAVVGR